VKPGDLVTLGAGVRKASVWDRWSHARNFIPNPICYLNEGQVAVVLSDPEAHGLDGCMILLPGGLRGWIKRDYLTVVSGVNDPPGGVE
jgi:hypothetical protein